MEKNVFLKTLLSLNDYKWIQAIRTVFMKFEKYVGKIMNHCLIQKHDFSQTSYCLY